MILGIMDFVTVPFGFLLRFLYQLINNYGWALIVFTIIVKLILLPPTAKSKKSMMKTSRLTPYVQAIQKKYANDPQKSSAAIRQLYKEENCSVGGGCLWSLFPLLILFPLYAIVREPITYILGESGSVAKQIVEIIKENAPEGVFTAKNSFYHQMIAAPLIPQYAEQLLAELPELGKTTLEGVNFTFLGINLAAIPSYKIWTWSVWNWAAIGGCLLPIVSAASQVLTSLITRKLNDSLVTNEKGLQDKEAVKNSDANQTTTYMLYVMPVMTLLIGYDMPAALSIYWIIQGLSSTAIDIILTKIYRKDYDDEDAQRRLKALQEEAEEAEKERVRAQRRAENPDGITANTSKKKLQQQQQKDKESARAAAARDYAIRKGEYVEEENDKPTTLSGIADRPFCKGRAYDPNRYGSNHTEE